MKIDRKNWEISDEIKETLFYKSIQEWVNEYAKDITEINKLNLVHLANIYNRKVREGNDRYFESQDKRSDCVLLKINVRVPRNQLPKEIGNVIQHCINITASKSDS